MRNGVRALVTLAVSLLCVCPAAAQSTSATLTGTIRTHEGTPLANVVVRARALGTGAARTTLSDASGRYRFDALDPGAWSIVAQVSGGVTSEARRVELHLLQTVVQDFTVGPALEESVTITAEAPLVDPGRIGGELRLDGEQISDLPISGRVLTDLALLDSTVTAAPPGNFYGERGSVFTVNGQSGRSNSFLVDGLDNNDQVSNTTMNAQLPQLAVREFVVSTRQYAPEFSRASGGILNVITERGENTPSGQFFFQDVPGGLGDPGEFVSSLPSEAGVDDTSSGLQTGFRIGGPLKKDRAFYFLAYEHLDQDQITTFTGVDRFGRRGGYIVSPNRDDKAFFRTDYNLPASHLSVTMQFGDRDSNGVNVAERTTPEAGFEIQERDFRVAAALATPLGANLTNELRVLYGVSSFDQFANSDRPGVERPSGLFGGNNLNRQVRDEARVQLVENLTWQAGRHTLKAGVDVIRSRTEISTAFNPNGNFLYDTDLPYEPGDCGDLIASQVDANDLFAPIPCPGAVGVDDDGDGVIDEPGIIGTYPIAWTFIEGKPRATLNDTRYGVFVQDSWQATRSFLLEYGLRYDLSTFSLPSDTRVPSTKPNGGAGRDRNNVAPRFGFSWSPGGEGRFVLRGGAGLFYDKLVLGFPAVAAITSGTQIDLIFPQGFTFEITEDVVEQLGIKKVKQVLQFLPTLILRFSTGTELETPYTTQYTLGAERAIGGHGALSAGVTRALGYHLPLMKDLNPVVDPQPLTLPVHEDPNAGSIAAIVTEGRSWYTALDLAWRWRGENGWYRTGYTWSKSIDMGPDPLKGGVTLPPDSHDLSLERGRSDADQRHRFTVSGGAGLPWWGLRVASVVQYSSGAPFNVVTGKDENVDGIATDRPAGVARNTGARTDLAGVNALRRANGLSEIHHLEEPEFIQVDFKLGKPFSVREGRAGGEVFLQVFNIFDRFNGGPVDGAVLSNNFGKPVGQIGPPRTVELGLRMDFGRGEPSAP